MKMKNENEDLIKSKIEIIDNDNTSVYQEIALLVDKPEYLRLIDKIREEYSIDEAVPADGDFAFLLSLFSNTREGDINLSKYKSLAKFKELLPKECDNVMSFTKNTIEVLRAQAEAVLMCFEFGRPFYFVPIVLQSIMYGVADTNWLQRTQAVVQDQDYALYRFDEIDIPQVVIEISPYSTEIDIKRALRNSKKIFDTDKRFKYFNKKADYTNKIRNYRHWYWENLSGKKYPEIADEWMKSPFSEDDDSGADENVILKGIQTYKELLHCQ